MQEGHSRYVPKAIRERIKAYCKQRGWLEDIGMSIAAEVCSELGVKEGGSWGAFAPGETATVENLLKTVRDNDARRAETFLACIKDVLAVSDCVARPKAKLQFVRLCLNDLVAYLLSELEKPGPVEVVRD